MTYTLKVLERHIVRYEFLSGIIITTEPDYEYEHEIHIQIPNYDKPRVAKILRMKWHRCKSHLEVVTCLHPHSGERFLGTKHHDATAYIFEDLCFRRRGRPIKAKGGTP